MVQHFWKITLHTLSVRKVQAQNGTGTGNELLNCCIRVISLYKKGFLKNLYFKDIKRT